MPAVATPPAATDWDYRAADTKQITHGIHPYPARMIPQVAKRLINTYGHEDAMLFDPYCGSGTTLLEGMLAGMKTVGTDLNPLARLITRVKTRLVNPCELDYEIARFMDAPPSVDTPPLPSIPNVDYWFSETAQFDLATIRQHIHGIDNAVVADAFRIAFSVTVRKSSWTRLSEFKLHRMPKAQLDKHNPHVVDIMAESLSNVREALGSLSGVAPHRLHTPSVYDFNTVTGVPVGVIAPGTVDVVITSPPYGDSQTTVAYGQFSRLSSQWLGYAEASQVDRMLMGGSRSRELERFGVKALDSVIATIAETDERRAREVASFFVDYRASIGNVAKVMRPGSYACYVVGNRTVKGQRVPTAEATAALFEANGFATVEVCTRNIPNKRIPSMNSPSNVPSDVGETITAEQIVVCRKV